MAELTDELRHEIVIALARFHSPAEIIKDLRVRGIECDNTQIGRYDPTRPYFQAAEKWRELFDLTRKAYIEEASSVPAANQGFRLNLLHEGVMKARASGNLVLMASLLEQVAKEVGGALTNERVMRSDGRPMQPDQMSAEERRVALLDILTSGLAGQGKVVHEGVATPQ